MTKIRHILYRPVDASGAPGLDTALQTARALGIKVLRTQVDSMLAEAESPHLHLLVAALPGWRHQPERFTAKLPERRSRRPLKPDKDKV